MVDSLLGEGRVLKWQSEEDTPDHALILRCFYLSDTAGSAAYQNSEHWPLQGKVSVTSHSPVPALGAQSQRQPEVGGPASLMGAGRLPLP